MCAESSFELMELASSCTIALCESSRAHLYMPCMRACVCASVCVCITMHLNCVKTCAFCNVYGGEQSSGATSDFIAHSTRKNVNFLPCNHFYKSLCMHHFFLQFSLLLVFFAVFFLCVYSLRSFFHSFTIGIFTLLRLLCMQLQ